jgi:tetratricopeptide (TPR) repeat protein
MDAGYPGDLPLIKKYILGKFETKDAFNQAIDRAILRLSPLSLIYQGRYDEAHEVCKQEIAMLKSLKCVNSAALAKAYSTMGTALWRLGQLEPAMDALTTASEFCLESDLELHGEITNRKGTILLDQGKYRDSLDMLSRSLDFRTRCFGNSHVSVASTQNNMAVVLKKQGKLEEALELYQKSLETTIRAVGPSHVSVAVTQNNMAVVLGSQGKLEEALELYQKSLETTIRAVGSGHVSVAETIFNMSIIYDNMGDASKGLKLTRNAHSICLAALGPDHPKTREYAQFV